MFLPTYYMYTYTYIHIHINGLELNCQFTNLVTILPYFYKKLYYILLSCDKHEKSSKKKTCEFSSTNIQLTYILAKYILSII